MAYLKVKQKNQYKTADTKTMARNINIWKMIELGSV